MAKVKHNKKNWILIRLINFYWQFIRNFSKIAILLTLILKTILLTFFY